MKSTKTHNTRTSPVKNRQKPISDQQNKKQKIQKKKQEWIIKVVSLKPLGFKDKNILPFGPQTHRNNWRKQ